MLRVIDAIASAKCGEDALFLDDVAGALLRSENFAVNVSKRSSVQFLENERRNFTEPLYGLVVAEGKADVVDLPAVISALRVGNEQNSWDWQGLGGDVEKRTVGLLPDGVKFCLDKNPRPLPHRPPENTLAANRSGLTLNQRETFVGWCAKQWPARNINRSGVRDDASAEPQHIGLDELGRAHTVLEQSNVKFSGERSESAAMTSQAPVVD